MKPYKFKDIDKSGFSLLLLIIFMITLISSLMLIKSFLGYLLIFIATFYLFIYFMKKNDVFLFKIILLAFSLRFFLSIINAYIWVLPSGRNDALSFEYSGWLIASSANNILNIFATEVEFYRKFIALTYYFTERNPLLIQHVSVIAGTLLVYIVYKIVMQISSSTKAAKMSAVLITFYPGLVQFSVFTRRESLIYFFTALSVYLFLIWFDKGKNTDFLKALIFLVVASIFHSGVAFLGIAYIFFYVFYKPSQKRWNISITKVLISIILLVSVFSFGDVVFRKLPELSMEGVEDTVSRKSEGGRTGYLQGVQPDSVLDFFVQTPIRTIYFLLTPFPWQIRTLTDIYGYLLDTLPMYFLLIYSLRTLSEFRKRNKKMYIMLLLLLVLLILPFAWGTSNYGTAIRHRQKIIWFLAALASIGYVLKKRVKKSVKQNSLKNI